MGQIGPRDIGVDLAFRADLALFILQCILLNFLRYSLSCFSPKIHLRNLWKPFQFVLDQNLCHFEANLFDRTDIFDLEMPLEDGEAQPDYPRPPCATSFFKSGLIRILQSGPLPELDIRFPVF